MPLPLKILLPLKSVDTFSKRLLFTSFVRNCFANNEPIIEAVDIPTIHHSTNYLAVCKPHDLVVCGKDSKDDRQSVATLLKRKYPDLFDPKVGYGFRFCHKIDFASSGVLCLALSDEANKQFGDALQRNRVNKYYLALVSGRVESDHLVISKDIGSDSRLGSTHKMCTGDREYCRDAKWALSKLLVLQRGMQDGRPATKVLLKLCTGRRHQLRLHCLSVGHGVIGDFTYVPETDVDRPKMFLHSYRLVLPSGIEPLDLKTDDPFTELDINNKWSPTETVNELNEEAFSFVSSIKS